MLDFDSEWLEAPGVRDSVLAATWARLEIRAGDGISGPRFPTTLVNQASNSVRRGVYGSAFPLVDWVVENWWFLLNESCRVPEFTGCRNLPESHRASAQRHCFLVAREGGSLPDLALYRDGEHVAVKWVIDPEMPEGNRPVRFIDDGGIRLSYRDAEKALHEIIEAVLDRLGNVSDPDAKRLCANWKAVCESRRDEADLCSWAASLGIDPYDMRGTDRRVSGSDAVARQASAEQAARTCSRLRPAKS